MGKFDGHKGCNSDQFKQLDLWCRWRFGGQKGPPPTVSEISFSVFSEWFKTQAARYRRATALHEGGHAVVAEILLPGWVKEVQLGKVSPLTEIQQEILGQGKADFVDGQTVYEQMEISDDHAADWLQRRITVVLAGMEFQTMEGFEAADMGVTEDGEVLLIEAIMEQFEHGFGISQNTQRQILDRAEGIIADLGHDGGIRKAVTEVADKLMVTSPISGSCVRQIVEGACSPELLERMRARL